MDNSRPIAIDLFTGKGGWAQGLSAAGWHVIGFDLEDKGHSGGELVLQDVLTLHGSQFRHAGLIVASPPCTEYSYMAMPFQRGKQIAAALRGEGPFPDGYTGSRTIEQLNTLFNACFRIQREACEAAGRHIPMVVENVKGAQAWVGKAKAHYGSFYLWGDMETVNGVLVAGWKMAFGVPTLCVRQMKEESGRKVNHHLNVEVPNGTGKSSWLFGNTKRELRDMVKAEDGTYGVRGWFGPHGGTNVTRDENGYGIKGLTGRMNPCGTKNGGDWFSSRENASDMRRFSSRSAARREASARIAMIPRPLAEYIGRAFLPDSCKIVGDVSQRHGTY